MPRAPLGPALSRSPASPRALAALLLCVGVLPGFGASKRATSSSPTAGPVASAPEATDGLASTSVAIATLPLEAMAVVAAPQRETRGRIQRGQSLGRALSRRGVDAATIHQIARGMRPVFDFRRSQPGDRYRLTQDASGALIDFRYRTRPESSYHLFRDGDAYVAREEPAVLVRRTARIAGSVRTSLYKSIADLGEQPELAGRFVDLFAWDIDFTRAVHAGDDFRILYERIYRVDGDAEPVYVRPGRIIAARFIGRSGEYSAVYFEPGEGPGSYFRPDGNALERQFVAAPLRFDRISSRFTSARRHPILHVIRPHHGIDYAAPEGSPVWSVADGTIIYRGGAGGFGNLVKIRHANGYVSYYGHLSRFAEGLHVGQHVDQKKVIGFVGHTGLATGPHVCFRIAQNGHYMDPLRVESPASEPIPEESWGDFQIVRDRLLADLDGDSLIATEEAL